MNCPIRDDRMVRCYKSPPRSHLGAVSLSQAIDRKSEQSCPANRSAMAEEQCSWSKPHADRIQVAPAANARNSSMLGPPPRAAELQEQLAQSPGLRELAVVARRYCRARPLRVTRLPSKSCSRRAMRATLQRAVRR